MDKDCVLIPAYQPDEKLAELVEKLVGQFDVLVVDDGSGEAYSPIFERAKNSGATVVRHSANRGKGAALKTGLASLIERGVNESVITADADGQHSPEDIAKVAAAMEKHPNALIIGGREFSMMPLRSRTGNTITRFFFRLVTGLAISDTQTGLRGLPPCLFDKLLKVEGNRYEYEMNMLLSIKEWGCEYREIPIKTIYIENNSSTHFHALRDGVLVFSRVLKYSLSSLVCTGVDFLVYSLLLFWLPAEYSYIAARVVSSTLNYQLNRRVVFKAKPSVASMVGYFALVVAVMLLGSFLVKTLDNIGWNSIIAKALVDLGLFFGNYIIQKKVIFREKAKS